MDGSRNWNSYICPEVTNNTHQFFSLGRVAIYLGDSVQEVEYSVGGDLGLGVVGGKSAGLSDGDGAKDEGRKYTEDVLEICVGHVILGEGDLVGSEAENGSVHEVYGGLGEGIGDAVHR